MSFRTLVQASLTSFHGRFQAQKQKSLQELRHDCRAAGEPLAPLNRPGSVSRERWCGLVRCRGGVSNPRDVRPDTTKPSFESLEHFHAVFDVDGCAIWYNFTVDEPLDVKEHNERGFTQNLMAFLCSSECCIAACMGNENEFHGNVCLLSRW